MVPPLFIGSTCCTPFEPSHDVTSQMPTTVAPVCFAMAKQTGATVVGIWEVTSWLGSKGVQHVEPMNKGGTITVKGLRITMTDARHSSSADKDLTDRKSVV